MTTKSQRQKIMAFLEAGNKLTALDALKKFQCFRLASRIHELKKAGYPVVSQKIELNGKKVSQYYAQYE